jgi:hypothetical protein
MLTRMFAYFTLFSYLVVGSLCVRFFMPEIKSVEISSEYFSLLSNTEIKVQQIAKISAPEIAFADIKFPAPVRSVFKPKKIILASLKPAAVKVYVVQKNELPFHEPVILNKVSMTTVLEDNLASLYVDFKYEMVASAGAPLIEDEISTTQSADAEPEFFEYKDEKVSAAAPEQTTEAEPTVVVEATPVEVSTSPQTVENVHDVDNVNVDDLIAFDYSKADADLKSQTMPTVSVVNTQGMIPAGAQAAEPLKWVDTPKPSKPKPVTIQQEEKNNTEKNNFVPEVVVPKTFPNRMTIQLTGTDLLKTKAEVGFEIRFQDDLSEAIQDYNSGEISMDQELSTPKMNRSITVLKLGFAPTNTDLILEEGVTELTIPAIEEDTFNELLAPYESRGPIGAVLVELDEKVEGASLDVPYSQVLKLTENMVVTEGDDFTYQLFVGVKAGNALLRYKGMRGDITSKIIHIHEREVTFESNFFEDVTDETVTLLEEDLMAKEMAPLILSAEEVKQFATSKTASKLNDHTYKTDFNRTLLGARKYLELSHQSEPVFVGFKEAKTLNIPSENFMRHILSKFEGGRLGSRCLVQVNLTKKAVKVDVGAESVGTSLMTYTQILDADGKFYDSISSKSAKIIVVGENQGAPDLGQDGKINLKITYQDGSIQYLGSYCSPNTYLVEQL